MGRLGRAHPIYIHLFRKYVTPVVQIKKALRPPSPQPETRRSLSPCRTRIRTFPSLSVSMGVYVSL
jgi:hypothetical protein